VPVRLAIQRPGLPLRHSKQPSSPVEVAIGLVLHELRPGERAGILDHLWRRREHDLRHGARELLVVRPEELGLVPVRSRARILISHLS
jgi:hypothetical protein